jgi:hypothetical protein
VLVLVRKVLACPAGLADARVLLEFGVWLGVIQAQCRASARLRGYKIV